MTAHMFYVHALSPIHVGMGQGTGVIDLPVIRESVTGWPILPGSGIKGVLRDACDDAGVSDPVIKIVFGPDTVNASDHAGGVIVPDLRLLCLPVRSYKGSFVWVTSPLALSRWLRDHTVNAIAIPDDVKCPAQVAATSILLPSETAKTTIAAGDVILEDFRLAATVDDNIVAIAAKIASACFADEFWRTFFTTHFGIVADTTLGFLTRTAMDIVARNKIDDDRKVVATGQLWYEESVPAESIFAGPLISTPKGITSLREIQTNADSLAPVIAQGLTQSLQIGGNASVGRGMVLAYLDPVVKGDAA